MLRTDPQMLKGVLSLLLLELLSEQENYGYQVVGRLRDNGFGQLNEGTVYPALTRLESQGFLTSRLVKSSSGPARKYYCTTPDGADELLRARSAWDQLVASVSRTLGERRTT